MVTRSTLEASRPNRSTDPFNLTAISGGSLIDREVLEKWIPISQNNWLIKIYERTHTSDEILTYWRERCGLEYDDNCKRGEFPFEVTIEAFEFGKSQPMYTPVRGNTCEHLLCFDFETYQHRNPNLTVNSIITCPHCFKKYRLQDLRIDKVYSF
jgi:hypothetical protein